MPAFSWVDSVPLWAVLPGTVLLVLAMIEVGYRYGAHRRVICPEEKEAPVGAMSAAALGLLAFFMAFTFGFVGGRFDERRRALLDEVNAIGTCALRSQTLPDELRGRIQATLVEYVRNRAEGSTPDKLSETIRRAEEMHTQLWSLAMQAVATDRSAVTALYVSSLNDVIDLHTTRVTLALRSRMPGVIWSSLLCVTVLSMAVLGYLEGLSRSSRSPAIIAIAIMFAIVMTLIADLDRPGEGTLRLGPQLMIDLQHQLERLPAAT
ncbi:MAG TPA: hypothetical protein VM452_17745 [Caulifigura sp.]|nr:hypothetical protein [Caulifigura sp.]